MAEGWGASDARLTAPKPLPDLHSLVHAGERFLPGAGAAAGPRLIPAGGTLRRAHTDPALVASRRRAGVSKLSLGRGEGPREAAPWGPRTAADGLLPAVFWSLVFY